MSTLARLFAVLALVLALGPAGWAGEGKFLLPLPRQVAQRDGFDPSHAHDHEPGGPRLGHANVPLVVEFPPRGEPAERFEFRIQTIAAGVAPAAALEPLPDARLDQGKIQASIRVPAGGWYRIELRGLRGREVIDTATVEPVGVGEVFVIAGQSYAAGANDALLRVDDAQGRVVALDVARRSWGAAHDPQPNVGDGGTIWPPFANALLPMVRVPIGLVNVASGGTASRQWLPGTPLHANLARAGREVGRFRAVLWQQGESDVIEKIDMYTYITRLKTIRESLAREWGFEPPWLLAKSTLHPTVYDDPAREGSIRDAIDTLWSMPGFRPGPDTDILGGENRGVLGTRRHFTALGQQRAGLLWFASVWNELQRAPTERMEPRPRAR